MSKVRAKIRFRYDDHAIVYLIVREKGKDVVFTSTTIDDAATRRLLLSQGIRPRRLKKDGDQTTVSVTMWMKKRGEKVDQSLRKMSNRIDGYMLYSDHSGYGYLIFPSPTHNFSMCICKPAMKKFVGILDRVNSDGLYRRIDIAMSISKEAK